MLSGYAKSGTAVLSYLMRVAPPLPEHVLRAESRDRTLERYFGVLLEVMKMIGACGHQPTVTSLDVRKTAVAERIAKAGERIILVENEKHSIDLPITKLQ